jgi:SAM-dependent methyltransferase
MPKLSNSPPPGHTLEDDDAVTPPPDVTLEPATPTPEILPIDNRSASGPVMAPVGERGSNGPAQNPAEIREGVAQAGRLLLDESTDLVPLDDVEFTEPDAEFSDDEPGPSARPAQENAERSGVGTKPQRPAMPPAHFEGRARTGSGSPAVDGENMPERPSPASPMARPAQPMPPPPRRGARPRPATPGAGSPAAGGAPASAAAAPPSAAHPFLQPGASWTEALSQRPRRKRLKPWFEEAFDEDYLRTLPFMTPDQTLREVAFIKQSLRPPDEGELLDVACGYGRHAIELGQGGYRVTGVDLSLPLLIRAADESQRRSLSVNFIHADMREMAFENQFDGAYNFLTSFGYFDEEANLKVASSICRALRPGGRFLLDTINRDYIVSDLPTRVWWEGDGCVVLEEVDFNFQTSRLSVRRSIVFQDGRQIEHDMSIRAYSLHELGKLLRQAGFRVLEVSGGVATQGYFFGSTSRSVIMLCERPAD